MSPATVDSLSVQLENTTLSPRTEPYEDPALFDLSKVPPNLLNPTRRHFFGYAVNTDWSRRYMASRGYPTEEMNLLTILFNSGDVLKREFKIWSIEWGISRRDEMFPPGLPLIDLDCVPILVVCSSWTRRKDHPSSEKVERMTELVGTRPRWWPDEKSAAWYGY